MQNKASSAEGLLALAGRVLIATLFLNSALGKIMGFQGVVGFVASKGLPLPAVLLAGSVLLEVTASLALLAGFRTRWAALALAGYSLLAGFLFHDFWAAPPAQAMMQQLSFFKNLGIAGGLLLVAALGPGRFGVGQQAPQ
ncbi:MULTISPECIES: DoxX family protein [Ramlibacter]|uniref:DoxX family membrane protein n=1 Tax=Ramlibacter pinisoli TaxID=2682844 RepID=A0A6N8IMG2_9BURK|nr:MULTISPECIES: DoxX family protein [Ramlibacter]MBA2960493.1 DoxX family protein [Ramlibacter sp. CGMCC 1.13660]MVQ27825.1 DoxX family membrane protein [Ramlibacter pinisoli]